MPDEIDIDYLRSWIGKRNCETDTITPELLKRFRATLGGHKQAILDEGPRLPLGIHWCLAQPAVTQDALGLDGHPAKGGFLPPVPLPRRMWASSKIQFFKTPNVGAPIERTSTIFDVVLKQSSAAGPLVFVQVNHDYVQGKETIIKDRQTIVYRQSSAFKKPAPQDPQAKPKKPLLNLQIVPDNTLLFRYSAMTFNGHRIHYDHNYATNEEGYPGLVVHGPLMATMLMNLAQASRPNGPLRQFEFRGTAPAFVDQSLVLSVSDNDAETLDILNQDGALIMTAIAEFDDHEHN